ncbi:immunity 49 family protein [Nocardia tengchongensis]|uniref:immunity 49 family protein n=1 Tax=Nocardia tengchongensis TaxID=2055889 RepID=UPI0036A33175
MATRAVIGHNLEIEDPDREVRSIAGGIERNLDRVAAHPRRLKNVLQASLRLAGLRSYLDPMANKLETWQAYVQVMQASSAIFEIATTASGSVEVHIGEQSVSIPAGSTQGIADAGNWFTAFCFAVMGRDQARLDMLSEVPIDLLRATGSVYDEYIYHWVDALKTYWSEGSGLGVKLRVALDSADPASVGRVPPDLMLKILYPPIDLFYRFLDEQRAEFNSTLAQALQFHDAFWNSDEDDRRNNRVGMIAVGPLAMACLAFDADFQIDVESDYLPRHILQRSWLGGFQHSQEMEIPEALRARVNQPPSPAIDQVREFLGSYVADSVGLDEVREHLVRLAQINRKTVERKAEAIEALLAAPQSQGTLSWMVAVDGNWVLDDETSDAAAETWLRDVAALIRGVLAETDIRNND